MNELKELEIILKTDARLPAMFKKCTAFYIEEIKKKGKELDIDFEWDLRRTTKVDKYATSEYFLTKNYFRPVTKY